MTIAGRDETIARNNQPGFFIMTILFFQKPLSKSWYGPVRGGTHFKQAPNNEIGSGGMPMPSRIVVTEIGRGMPLGNDRASWKKSATDWLLHEKNIRGQVRIASTGRNVLIERDGIKEAIRRAGTATDLPLRVIGHIGDLLSHAVLKESETADRKMKRRGENVVAYHHYYAPAIFDGRFIVAHMPVMETDRGHLFYDCKSLEMKMPEPDSATQHPESSGLQPRASHSGMTITMQQFMASVNTAWAARITARKLSGRHAERFSKSTGGTVLFLKATVNKTITIPGYTKKDGTIVPSHQKVVKVSLDVNHEKVATGGGTHYQKEAHKKLSATVSGWDGLSIYDKSSLIHAHATDAQDAASDSAAVSMWKKSVVSGQKPKPSQQAAMAKLMETDAPKAAKVIAEAEKAVGGHENLMAILGYATLEATQSATPSAKPEAQKHTPVEERHSEKVSKDMVGKPVTITKTAFESHSHMIGKKGVISGAVKSKNLYSIKLDDGGEWQSYPHNVQIDDHQDVPADKTPVFVPDGSDAAVAQQEVSKILNGHGGHYPGKAAMKLTGDIKWQQAPPVEQLQMIVDLAKQMQAAATASAALSGHKKSIAEGKVPTASQMAAFSSLPDEKQNEHLAKLVKQYGGAHVAKLHNAGVEKHNAKKPANAAPETVYIGKHKGHEIEVKKSPDGTFQSYLDGELTGDGWSTLEVAVAQEKEAVDSAWPTTAKPVEQKMMGVAYQKVEGGWEGKATGNISGPGSAKYLALQLLSGGDAGNLAAYTEDAKSKAFHMLAGSLTSEDAIYTPPEVVVSVLNQIYPPNVSSIGSYDGPQEGDTKDINGVTYILKNGRWHKINEEIAENPQKQAEKEQESPKWSANLSNTTDGHNKFYSVEIDGTKLTKKWGPIGKKGQTLTINFMSHEAALDEAMKIVGDKTKGGYIIHPGSGYSYHPGAGGNAGKNIPDSVAVEKKPQSNAKPKTQSADPVFHIPKSVHGSLVGVMDSWEKVGDQQGSNNGGIFKDKSGQKWYCKFPSDPDVVRNEFLAAKFYQMLGVGVPNLKLVEKDGKLGIASKWVDGLKKAGAGKLSEAHGVHEAFAIDAWLGNWDVVGLSNDNLLLDKDGKAIRVDSGGALLYRAQGGKKGEDFGSDVKELDSLIDAKTNPQAAAVFAGVSDMSMRWGLDQLNKLKPSQIEELCEKAGPGTDAEKKALAAKLIARRAAILKKHGIADQWDKPPVDESTLPVNPSDIPNPIDFVNYNGQGKGMSSKDWLNHQNSKDSAALAEFASKGNLAALKDYQYDAVDKETGKPIGKKPITDHPSKHIKEQWAGLVELLQSIAYPPVESLQMPSMGAASSVEEVSDIAGAFSPTETVETIAAEHRMGFFMKLGQIDDISDLLAGVEWKHLTSSSEWVKSAFAKFKSFSGAVKAYIGAVQASGWINHVFSQGKTTVSASGNGGKYHGGTQTLASKIYAEAVEIPEGTILKRGMTDTTAGKSMTKQFLEAKPGMIIQNTDSMCASYNEGHSWGGGVQMHIRCPKGAKGTPSFASGHYGGEHEITTLPGARFVILSTKPGAGGKGVIVDCLMLPPHEGYVAELNALEKLGKALLLFFKRSA